MQATSRMNFIFSYAVKEIWTIINVYHTGKKTPTFYSIFSSTDVFDQYFDSLWELDLYQVKKKTFTDFVFEGYITVPLRQHTQLLKDGWAVMWVDGERFTSIYLLTEQSTGQGMTATGDMPNIFRFFFTSKKTLAALSSRNPIIPFWLETHNQI